MAGKRGASLLHPGALTKAAEINDEETGVLEQRADLGLGVGVVTGDEDHTAAACLVRIGAYVKRTPQFA